MIDIYSEIYDDSIDIEMLNQVSNITPPSPEPLFMEGGTEQIYTEVVSGNNPLFTEPAGI